MVKGITGKTRAAAVAAKKSAITNDGKDVYGEGVVADIGAHQYHVLALNGGESAITLLYDQLWTIVDGNELQDGTSDATDAVVHLLTTQFNVQVRYFLSIYIYLWC